MRIKILILVLLAMTLFNCNNNNKNTGKVDSSQTKKQRVLPDSENISVQFLKSEFDSGEEFYLLDVRTQPEFNEAHLSFTDNLIPYDSMQLYLDKLPQDKETLMYIFCRSSRRSGIATTYLRSLGYTHAYNVSGGIIAWIDAGYSVTSK